MAEPSPYRTPDEVKRERDRVKAVELYALGLATSAISERLGRSRELICRWVTAAGVRQKGDPPRARYDGCGGGLPSGRVSPRIDGGHG